MLKVFGVQKDRCCWQGQLVQAAKQAEDAEVLEEGQGV